MGLGPQNRLFCTGHGVYAGPVAFRDSRTAAGVSSPKLTAQFVAAHRRSVDFPQLPMGVRVDPMADLPPGSRWLVGRGWAPGPVMCHWAH